jgi:integrase
MKLKLDAKTTAGMTLGSGRSEEFCWDTELEGYGLRLRRRRNGGGLLRTWIAQYRASGHTRRVTIGSADKIAPAQAREAARKILARVALGQDPQAEKAAKRQRAVRTFRAVVDAYLAAKRPELRPVSNRLNELYLRAGPYFRPLHSLGIGEIAHPDIAARLSAIVRNHSPHTAAAARRAVSALFRWAMEEGWVETNPVIGTRKPADPMPRDRVLTNAELAAIWRACGDDDHGRAMKLLILLGSRRSEVGGMRWSELDLEVGTWTLPAERSKNHRAHTIALPAAALAVIELVPRTTRDHLFGDRAGAGFTSWSRGKLELDGRLAGTVKTWRVHDLRRTVATRMADIGIEPFHIEACLNHYSGHRRGAAGVYNRSNYGRAVKAALARWAGHVRDLVEGRESNVVPLHA